MVVLLERARGDEADRAPAAAEGATATGARPARHHSQPPTPAAAAPVTISTSAVTASRLIPPSGPVRVVVAELPLLRLRGRRSASSRRTRATAPVRRTAPPPAHREVRGPARAGRRRGRRDPLRQPAQRRRRRERGGSSRASRQATARSRQPRAFSVRSRGFDGRRRQRRPQRRRRRTPASTSLHRHLGGPDERVLVLVRELRGAREHPRLLRVHDEERDAVASPDLPDLTGEHVVDAEGAADLGEAARVLGAAEHLPLPLEADHRGDVGLRYDVVPARATSETTMSERIVAVPARRPARS